MQQRKPEAPPVPDGYMMDGAGRLVPVGVIKPEHLLEDELVREIARKAAEASAVLQAFKFAAFADITALVDLLHQQYGAAKGGAKGNLTLNSFDGAFRVQVAIGDHLSFGPELQAAKTLIDTCLKRWTEGANINLQAIIDDAFDVGKEGKLRVDRILGLKRLAITDEEWVQAMTAISDAVRVVSSRRYVRIYHRDHREAPYVQVPLDLANA